MLKMPKTFLIIILGFSFVLAGCMGTQESFRTSDSNSQGIFSPSGTDNAGFVSSYPAPSESFSSSSQRKATTDLDDYVEDEELGGSREFSAEELSEELVASERLVIHTATLSLEVSNVEITQDAIRDIITEHQGYILSSRSYALTDSQQQRSASVTLKVPAPSFSTVIDSIKELAVFVASEQLDGQDVTEEYVDITSRLKNLQATEEQLLKIMDQAKNVEEVLQVQRELTRNREQQEQIQGRKQYLEKSAQMATITVDLSLERDELPLVEERWNPLATAKMALRGSIRLLQFVVDVAIWSIIVLGPFAVVLGLVIWRVLVWVKKRKKPSK